MTGRGLVDAQKLKLGFFVNSLLIGNTWLNGIEPNLKKRNHFRRMLSTIMGIERPMGQDYSIYCA